MNNTFMLPRFTPLPLLSQSLAAWDGVEYGMARSTGGRQLLILADCSEKQLLEFEGSRQEINGKHLVTAPLSAVNAAVLRSRITWLQPGLAGLKTSAGMGDRLGLATPGHIRAVRACGGRVFPIFAQQSIREMARTGRTPQQVMDDAVWGIFQEGWRDGFGADADHLKTTQDIDACLTAGFTFFTVDPGEFVDDRAETSSLVELKHLVRDLPVNMQLSENGLLDKEVALEQFNLRFTEDILLKAMVKYGRAVWHVAEMYQHLVKAAGRLPFELEVSVDETAQPTSHAEHYYIASELKRMGVKWVSLAPRYVGAFEKGVDYIGDPAAFEQDIAGHAAIARHFGPYKLSLHSGSDKFSIYPAAVRQARGLVHLKTAGTSYLEAIRTVAALDPPLFREIYAFSLGRYEQDKASYHVSARPERAAGLADDASLAGILDQFDAREILHVCFGSVLKEKQPDGTYCFYDRLIGLLESNPEAYAANLQRHFLRHLKPFCTIG